MTDALLLIDLQVDFLAENGRMPIAQDQVEEVLRASEAACIEARRLGWAIVAIGNEFGQWNYPANLVMHFAAQKGAAGAAWDPRAPKDWDAYFDKHSACSFTNAGLDRWLRERGVERLHLAGVMAGSCVAATALGGLRRGYEVSLIPNGIGAVSERARVAALKRLRRAGCGISEAADQPMGWFRQDSPWWGFAVEGYSLPPYSRYSR